jgi:hypothetical protein
MANPWDDDEEISAKAPWDHDPEVKQTTGVIPAALEGVGQGLTLGFSDEIEAGVRAAYDKVASGAPSYTDAYSKRLEGARERQDKAASDQPVAYYGGEIGSSIAVPMGLSRLGVRGAAAVAGNAKLLPRTWAGVKEGATYGGIYGAGKSEGDLGDVALGTLGGAAAGGAVGGALPGLVDLASNTVRGVTRPIQAMLQPNKVGNQKIAEALLRDRSPTGLTPKSPDQTVAEIEARLARVRGSQPDVMLGDLGGENTRNLVRAAANMPSTGAQKLNRNLDFRQANAPAQIERALAQGLDDPKAFYKSVDDLADQMDQAGKTVIQPALKIDTPMTPRLVEVLQRPTMQELQKVVERRIADEGRKVPMTRTEALHRMKMELDEQIGDALRAKKMGNKPQAGWDAGTLMTLKKDLLNAIDNKAYKAGLKQYASKAQLQNAAEAGLDDALKMPVEEIRKTLAGLTAAEQKMWRLGASRALAGKVRTGNVLRDRTEGLFSSPDMQMRLKAIFPDQRSLREFQRHLVIQAKKADFRKAVQGNSTTAKQLAQGQEAGQEVRAVAAAANAATGRFEPLMAFMGRQAQRFSGLTPSSANAIIEAAMTRGGNGLSKELQRALREAAETPALRARLVERMIAGSASVGSNAAPQEGLQGQTPYRRRFDDNGGPLR